MTDRLIRVLRLRRMFEDLNDEARFALLLEIVDELYDCYAQGCLYDKAKKQYSHNFISAYESAQYTLLDLGMLDHDQCSITTDPCPCLICAKKGDSKDD